VPSDVRALIRDLLVANPLWGAPRIHGELLKLGISIGQSTLAKFMRRRPSPPAQTWRTFAAAATTLTGMHIEALRTAPRSPWQNAYVERVIGSIRRECLDHVIVANEAGLRQALAGYVAYYMRSRTHLALAKDSPVPRPVQSPTTGRIVATPEVGGLHHRYARVAA